MRMNSCITVYKNYDQEKDNEKQVTIVGRRWFERYNGNTYHSAFVYVSTELYAQVNFAYGYGSQYEQTGLEILQEIGYYKITGEHFSNGYSKDFDQLITDIRSGKILSVVSDVKRKKDLIS